MMKKSIFTYRNEKIQKHYTHKRKDINLRWLVQDMGANLATEKSKMKKCRAWGKEDVVNFQDLSQCASRQSNSWEDSDNVYLNPNKQRCLSLGNDHTLVSH